MTWSATAFSSHVPYLLWYVLISYDGTHLYESRLGWIVEALYNDNVFYCQHKYLEQSYSLSPARYNIKQQSPTPAVMFIALPGMIRSE